MAPGNPGKPWIFILVLENPSKPWETELGIESYLNFYSTLS
jgi:hypothetical protein